MVFFSSECAWVRGSRDPWQCPRVPLYSLHEVARFASSSHPNRKERNLAPSDCSWSRVRTLFMESLRKLPLFLACTDHYKPNKKRIFLGLSMNTVHYSKGRGKGIYEFPLPKSEVEHRFILCCTLYERTLL